MATDIFDQIAPEKGGDVFDQISTPSAPAGLTDDQLSAVVKKPSPAVNPNGLSPQLPNQSLTSGSTAGVAASRTAPLLPTVDDIKNALPDSESYHSVMDDISQNKAIPATNFEVTKDDSIASATGKTIANLVTGIPKFLGSPLGVASLASGSVFPRIVAGLFALDTGKSVAQKADEVTDHWDKLTPGEKAAAITDVTGNTFMTLLLAKGAIKPETAAKKEVSNGNQKQETGGLPAQQGQPVNGQAKVQTEVGAPQRGGEGSPDVAIGQGEASRQGGDEVAPMSKPDVAKLSDDQLKSGYDQYQAAAANAMKAGDLQKGIDLATTGQWHREEIQRRAEAPAAVQPQAKPEEPTPTPQPPEEDLVFEGSTPLDPQTGNPIESPGMGAMKAGELGPSGNAEVYGIAARVREQRALAGRVDPIAPGTGIAPADSVLKGRQMIKSGADPEAALANFEKTGKFDSSDIAITRAHGEALNAEATRIEEEKGTGSSEYQLAKQKLNDWDKRTKPMQTDWSKSGSAQQGQTDTDTGSFTGLQRAWRAATDKDFTPEQETGAKKVASKVKKAAKETDDARQKLYDHLNKEIIPRGPSATAAEKAALDAAHKTVRNAAARLADEVSKRNVEQAKAQGELDKIQQQEAKRAADAAVKTVRQSATDLAKTEAKKAELRAKLKKASNQEQEKAARKALDAANKTVTDAAARLAEKEAKNNAAKADTSSHAWQKFRDYLDQGLSGFDDITEKIATDMGLSSERIRQALAKTKTAKTLTDELYTKQNAYRNAHTQAKRWLADQNLSRAEKIVKAIPDLTFAAKVFGHGTVAPGTHAPAVLFQPPYWGTYFKNIGKEYRMVFGNPLSGAMRKDAVSYYEQQMQDLVRKPNFITAKRAGLVNDPFQYEDYNSPDVTKFFGWAANMGNRGYSMLKLLRQDMFDQQWNALPDTVRKAGINGDFPNPGKTSEVAAAIADAINHATGVVKVNAPKGANIALFAPRLELSRAAWLFGDPVRAGNAFLNWKNATPAEKTFAVKQIKEKAWVTGTLLSLLAANQGFLSATSSDQKINFHDPMKSDWLKFKAAGMTEAYGNAMVSMIRLPARLYKIRESNGGKLKNVVYPDEDTYSVLGQFGRSQLSPFASLATTLWLKADYENRPLPNSTRPVPSRLRAQGVKPYTWPEFWSEQFLPIPAEEAVREVWSNGLGMNSDQIKQARKALATIAIMAATGARITDDTEVRAKTPEQLNQTENQTENILNQ